MYEIKQRGRRRWLVVVTDLAKDEKTTSPEMKTRKECSQWIRRHVADTKSESRDA